MIAKEEISNEQQFVPSLQVWQDSVVRGMPEAQMSVDKVDKAIFCELRKFIPAKSGEMKL